MTYFVALLSDDGRDDVQVCDSRQAALIWLVQQITQRNWEIYFDSLQPDERPEGLVRQLDQMDPQAAIVAYAGQPDDDPDGSAWGIDSYFMAIFEQELFSQTTVA